MTPLYRAVLAGDLDAVRLALAQGADVNARNEGNRWSALMVAIAEGFHAVAAFADSRRGHRSIRTGPYGLLMVVA